MFIKRSFAFVFLIVIFFHISIFLQLLYGQSRGPLGAVARTHCTGDRSIRFVFLNFFFSSACVCLCEFG